MPTGEKDSQVPSADIALNRRNVLLSSASLIALTATGATTAEAQQPQPAALAPTGGKPNIVFIMGDDIGWFNIGAYHQGMMAGRTPNLDRLAVRRDAVHRLLRRGELHRGPGELHHRRAADPHRADHRRPGRRHDRHAGAGADDRHGAQVDGLRHRPVRQEPPRRPQRVPADGARLRRVLRLPLPPRRDGGPGASATTRRSCKDKVGPRNMLHSWATDTDDPTEQPRWGKVGKQKIEDAGTLYPKRMETVDDEILEHTPSSSSTRPKERRQAVLRLAEPDAHARRHAPLRQVREDAQRRERLVRSTRPAWPSSTTSSARS